MPVINIWAHVNSNPSLSPRGSRTESQPVDVEHWEQLEQWVGELNIMDELGYKADIEAVYSVGGYVGLKEMVVNAVLRGQYI